MLAVAALDHVPGFVPGVVISVIAGVIAHRQVARRLGVGPVFALFFVVSIGAILAATLTPLDESAAGSSNQSVCDFSRTSLASATDIWATIDVGLNIVMFVPVGTLLAMLPRSRAKAILILIALASPLVIETTQLLAVPLDRACQSGDVIDNLTGLVVGLGVGMLAKLFGSTPEDPLA